SDHLPMSQSHQKSALGPTPTKSNKFGKLMPISHTPETTNAGISSLPDDYEENDEDENTSAEKTSEISSTDPQNTISCTSYFGERRKDMNRSDFSVAQQLQQMVESTSGEKPSDDSFVSSNGKTRKRRRPQHHQSATFDPK